MGCNPDPLIFTRNRVFAVFVEFCQFVALAVLTTCLIHRRIEAISKKPR